MCRQQGHPKDTTIIEAPEREGPRGKSKQKKALRGRRVEIPE